MKAVEMGKRILSGAAALALAAAGFAMLPANAQPAARPSSRLRNRRGQPQHHSKAPHPRSGETGSEPSIFSIKALRPATFDISLVERVMLPSGEIKALAEARTEPDLQPIVNNLASAQSLLVATPRRVTLAPGKVKRSAFGRRRRPMRLGEYRTHLTVATVPPARRRRYR
jgi:hypothetical protein